MKRLILYLLPFLFLSLACSKSKEKVLYPTKVKVGSTQYEFLYNPHSHNRIYGVTTTRPDAYAEFTYEYGDEFFHDPNHRWKNKIMRITNTPDRDITGWDAIDSVYALDRKENLLLRNKKTGLVSKEDQMIYMFKPDIPDAGISRYKRENKDDLIRQTYNAENQLTESAYYAMYHTKERQDTVGVLTRKVAYAYSQGKLTKASFYAADSSKPYLEIALAYDDKPGYLRNLPLEARFLPLELPYRDHNIIRYTVRDGQGRIRKDLSYTCAYTYNRDGYPDTFTRNMLNGQKIKGHMVYRAESTDAKEIAAADLSQTTK